MEVPSGPRISINLILMNDAMMDEAIPNSHYTISHWAREIAKTLVRIGNINELVVALIDDG